MDLLPLGPDGVCVSPIILGTMAYGPDANGRRQVATLRAALDAGITTFDTAPIYNFGEAERVLGKALEGREATVLGKVGLRWESADDHGDVLFRSGQRVVRKDGRPTGVRLDVERSLTHLGRDALDLCQVHHPDVHTPIADTMGELLRLRDEGKIRAIGVCNFDATQLEQARRALGDVPLVSHQFEYSLLAPEGRAVAEASQRCGAAALVYSPLRRGVLGGRAAGVRRLASLDPRQSDPAFAWGNATRIDAAVRQGLRPVARKHGVRPAQVALAWLLANDAVRSVIVGASRPSQAWQAAEAAQLRLDAPTCTQIADAFEDLRLDDDPQRRKRDRAVLRLRRLGRALGQRVRAR